MPIQESGEMYLETIYVLSKKSGTIRSIDVCEQMGYSKPSISRAIGILKKGGYIFVDEDGYITMSAEGKQVSEQLYERHTIITGFLKSLGVPSEVASEDACRIEHCISEESFEAIKTFIERFGEKT